MILSQIVAIGENYAIGKDNKLLWHFPEDLKYFKLQTIGKIMIMGRKTFDSLGKPLPKRFHIVISRQPTESNWPNVRYVTSIDEALDVAKPLIGEYPEEIMIVGGAEIYKQTLNKSDRLYVTRIPGSFDADSFYPENYSVGFSLKDRRNSEEHEGLAYEIWEKTSK
jgi:dihydrofolate reductase